MDNIEMLYDLIVTILVMPMVVIAFGSEASVVLLVLLDCPNT